MESYRGRHSNKKQMKGIALVNAILISILVSVGIGGLYLLLDNLFETRRSVREFTNVKDAVKSGVDEAIIEIRSNAWTPVHCNQGVTREYRVIGSDQPVVVNITICPTGSIGAGFGLEGVAETRGTTGGQIYRIVSESNVEGREGASYSRVEALYVDN